MGVSVSVCMSVCLHAYLENHASKLHQIFCTCGMNSVSRSSTLAQHSQSLAVL